MVPPRPQALLTAASCPQTHVDISHNGLNADHCRILGKGLQRNTTILGLHVHGNACGIDALGFVIPFDPMLLPALPVQVPVHARSAQASDSGTAASAPLTADRGQRRRARQSGTTTKDASGSDADTPASRSSADEASSDASRGGDQGNSSGSEGEESYSDGDGEGSEAAAPRPAANKPAPRRGGAEAAPHRPTASTPALDRQPQQRNGPQRRDQPTGRLVRPVTSLPTAARDRPEPLVLAGRSADPVASAHFADPVLRLGRAGLFLRPQAERRLRGETGFRTFASVLTAAAKMRAAARARQGGATTATRRDVKARGLRSGASPATASDLNAEAPPPQPPMHVDVR